MGTVYTLAQPLIAGTAYTFAAFVGSQADTNIFQTSVTLAAGDVKLSKDGAAFANLTNLPVETGTSGMLVVSLTTAETTSITNYAVVKFTDAAGPEWQDVVYIIPAMSAVTTLDVTDILSDSIAFQGADIDASISSIAAAIAATGATPAAGDLLDIVKYTTYNCTITGMTISAGWTWFIVSIKEDLKDSDDDALLRVKVTNGGAAGDGLLRINKQVPTACDPALSAADASLTINQGAGTCAIYITDAATTELDAARSLGYDAKENDGTDTALRSTGMVNIKATETQAT
ncbi:MAG: hypothetical protein GY832_03775 [Chloroflexi bacterium]|nr:hypothetical protein [Chloroflexota bacterium]